MTQNPSLMSGVPEPLVLRLLSAREMYGYELARAIRETTREAHAGLLHDHGEGHRRLNELTQE